MFRPVLVFAAGLLVGLTCVRAQPLDRLSGKVLGGHGEGIKDAEVRVEAVKELNKAHNVMRGTY